MESINKILVPTDFSENAEMAYKPAQKIARHWDARVDYMHIIPTLHYFNESMSSLNMPLDSQEDSYPQLQKDTSEQLEKLMKNNIEDGERGSGIIEIAPKPSRALTEYASNGEYDLIVMAARGKHATEKLRGSITEKVIRYSSTPLLMLDRSEFSDINQILLPVDGSPTSLDALPQALLFAAVYDAEITFYHVQELHGSYMDNIPMDTALTSEENVRENIIDSIDEFIDQHDEQASLKSDPDDARISYADATIDINIDTEKGISAHNAITDYATENADMVAMATHGRSGLAHMFLGSTAEKVARHLELPLLTVTPEAIKSQN